MGKALGLGLDQSQFGNNTQFGTGLVTVWEEHSVLDWASHIVGRTLGLGLGRSHCGKNTHRLRVFENEPGEDIRA